MPQPMRDAGAKLYVNGNWINYFSLVGYNRTDSRDGIFSRGRVLTSKLKTSMSMMFTSWILSTRMGAGYGHISVLRKSSRSAFTSRAYIHYPTFKTESGQAFQTRPYKRNPA